jgi:ketosteroid isomerase-like protein
MHTPEQINAIIKDLFDRISSDGRDPVGAVFTDDARYEGAYGIEGQEAADNALEGAAAISKFFHEYLPGIFTTFAQWPVTVYPVIDGDTALVEYASRGEVSRNDYIYENRYVGLFRFKDGKIAFMREYFNPIPYGKAVDPDYIKTVAAAKA